MFVLSAVRKTVHVGFRRRPVEILKGVDLTVQRADVFGLLGPNGAGKTTTVKVALGLMRPSSGSVELGLPGLSHVGYMPENPYFYDYLSGREFLGFCARLFGLDADVRRERVEALLNDVGLLAAADTHLRKYSKGMLQRVGIAQALINDPELVLLDEPMTGLDPIGRVEVKRIIERLHERGKTVMFNSHILSDVHELCLGGRCRRGPRRGALARGLLHEGGDGVKQVVAIAINTFKETIRDRVLAVIVVFALLMIAGGLWLGNISLGEQGRMIKDFGLVAVTGFGLIVAVFVAASLVHKEVEKRTVFVLFSKPVSRVAFITGKFIGLCGTMAIVLAGMGLFLFMLVWAVAGEASGMVLLAVLMIYVQLLAVVAVTIFFSTMGSAILAAVLGICVFVAGQLSHNVLALTRLGKNPITEALSWVVYVVIPNFSAVDVKAGAVGEQTLAWGQVGLWSVYLLAYIVVALALATLIFRRKEF
jgi:ABC-type Na+ transport system ATPase subunit NatA/ABC-type transport system involved in multi-copper enzyme maturation permease subunit